MNPFKNRARIGLCCTLLAPGLHLLAQDADSDGSAVDDEDVYTLSPFVVNEEPDTWSATQTLAGSRLNTELTDVASQIEVMTMEFMDTFSLNSIEEAAIYSLNAESPQETTGAGISGLGDENIRIRGISSGTRAREYFRTGISTDNYNLTRVSISSGPNSILFGTGSASGAFNSTISRAQTHREFGKIQLQADSFGGYRAQLDFNKVVVEDKFAIRAAAVRYKQAFDEDEAYIDNSRIYLTALWRPTKKTTISAHTEFVKIENRRPVRSVPFDNITNWYESNDILNQIGAVDAENPTIPNQTLFNNDADWVADGRNLTTNENRLYGLNGDDIVLLGGPHTGAMSVPFVWRNSVNVDRGGQLTQGESVNRNSNGFTLLNNDYFDLDMHTTLNFRTRDTDATINNFFFTHELFKNFFIDYGYHHEKNNPFSFEGPGFVDGYRIKVDPNMYLPGADGTMVTNPYAGQLYVDGGGSYNRGYSINKEWRAAVSYEFDVTEMTDNKWLGILGRHRIAGMLLDRTGENKNQRYDYQMMPRVFDGVWQDGYFAGYPYADEGPRAIGSLGEDFRIENRGFRFRSYFGEPGDLSIPELPNGFEFGQPFTVTDGLGNEFYMDPENAAFGTNGERLTTGRAAGGRVDFLETEQLAWQSFFWGNRIVGTVGWREDTTNSARLLASGQLGTQWLHPGINAPISADGARLRNHYDDVPFVEYDPATEDGGRTTLRGAVFKPFHGWSNFELPLGASLSFSYVESNTFQPNTTERNPNGTLIPGEEGETEEEGIRLGLFNNRFRVNYNKYETIASPTKLFLPFRRWRFRWREGGGMRDVIVMMAGADKQIFDSIFPNPEDWPLRATDPNYDPDEAYPFGVRDGGFATNDFDNYADPYTFITDSKATGEEITVTWEPVENLTLRATWNDQEVVQSNLGQSWFQFTEEYIDIMDRTTFTEGYVPGIRGLDGYNDPAGTDLNGDGIISQYNWSQIPYGGNGNGRNIINAALNNGGWGDKSDPSVTWTRDSMRERFFSRVINSNNGTTVMKAFDGRPNDFLRKNRININAQYRFTNGALKGTRISAAYRYRAGAGIGVGTQVINGAEVPDTDIILKGPDSEYVDLAIEWRGKSRMFGLFDEERRMSVGVNVRNLFDEGPYEVEKVDASNLMPTNILRVDGRQIVLKTTFDL